MYKVSLLWAEPELPSSYPATIPIYPVPHERHNIKLVAAVGLPEDRTTEEQHQRKEARTQCAQETSKTTSRPRARNR